MNRLRASPYVENATLSKDENRLYITTTIVGNYSIDFKPFFRGVPPTKNNADKPVSGQKNEATKLPPPVMQSLPQPPPIKEDKENRRPSLTPYRQIPAWFSSFTQPYDLDGFRPYPPFGVEGTEIGLA